MEKPQYLKSARTICIHFEANIFRFIDFVDLCDDYSISMTSLNVKLIFTYWKQIRLILDWKQRRSQLAISNRAKEYENQHRPWYLRLQSRIIRWHQWKLRRARFFNCSSQIEFGRQARQVQLAICRHNISKCFDFDMVDFYRLHFNCHHPHKISAVKFPKWQLNKLHRNIRKLKIAINWNIFVENGISRYEFFFFLIETYKCTFDREIVYFYIVFHFLRSSLASLFSCMSICIQCSVLKNFTHNNLAWNWIILCGGWKNWKCPSNCKLSNPRNK